MKSNDKPSIAELGRNTRFGAPNGNIPNGTRELKMRINKNRERALAITDRLIGAVEVLVEDAENLTRTDGERPFTAEEHYARRIQGAEMILAKLDTPMVRALIDAKEMGEKFNPTDPADEKASTDRDLAMRVMLALARGLDASQRETKAIDVTPDDADG